MSKLSIKKIKSLKELVSNKKISISKRRDAYKELQDALLNPKSESSFDPETFDPMDGVSDYEAKKRIREKPPEVLPTMGMKPKKMFEGQMIGMFESKQDLYLMIAHVNNTLLDKIKQLEDEINLLKS